MKVLVLFGAGASYGSGDVYPEPPPLGDGLFSALQNIEGSVASRMDMTLAKKFMENFEQGMAELVNPSSTMSDIFQRELALFFLKYSPGLVNNYRTLMQFFQEKNITPIFASTNYETILEQSLLRCKTNVCYGPFDPPEGCTTVLKVHGSCNFLPKISGTIRQGIFEGIRGPHIDSPIRASMDVNEILKFCREEDVLTPCLAVYAAGKPVLQGTTAIHQIQRYYAHVASVVDRIYVIGLRVNPNDEHIWSPLAASQAPLRWVGRERNEFNDWLDATRRTNAEGMCEKFGDALRIMEQEFS